MEVEDDRRPRRGRKRSEESRRAILESSLALVGESGYKELTIEGIAARAGVGKQTIYRWWPSKAAVVLEALNATASLQVQAPDTGTLGGDLDVFLTTTFAAARRQPTPAVLRALMAEAQLDDAFADLFRSEFLQRRREALAEIVSRAKRRGGGCPVIPEDVLIDIVFGVLWYRLLATRAPLDDSLAAYLTKLIVGNSKPADSGA